MLSEFKLPKEDVRLVRFGNAVYKIKLQYRETRKQKETQKEAMEFWSNPQIQCDIEKVIRYVLHKKEQEELEPIRTDHLVVYSYRKIWSNAQNLRYTINI